ncbi:UDP-glucuronosyltransferase 2B2-like [Rhopalosiphum maidis]|uniref:UDP-glucuronosyltransferase 2B2-like n=1 Tax=Rhopalosiphum maidis TaxID=43146 RepID=UPI000EFF8EA7|nr:UDP-glucuronosyltransferase 2B2-like [Rhopalosiphum maidis]
MSPAYRRRALVVLVLYTAEALTAASPSPGFRAANILAVETVPGRSHWNFMSAVLRALTDRGHSVVAFTSYPTQTSRFGHGNYTEVDTSGVLLQHAGECASRVLSDYSRLSYIVPSVVRWSREFCDAVYDMEQIRALMVNGTDTAARFDLLVTEPLGSECVAHLAAAVGLPMVYVVPTPMITYMQPSIVGHSANPAYVPHLLYGSAVRAFRHRLANTAVYAYGRLVRWYAELTANRRPYDVGEPAKPSVVFVNSHHVTEPTMLLPRNVVHVGGIHLDRASSGKLPTNIKEFIENSPHGVIYFTFGSVVAMSSLPDHIQDTFKNVFRQIPQRVLWKFEGEMKDKPDNVMTGNWFPQRDVLLHPNVKLFISHGGISGVYEAVDAGVPVLGFPLYYDQPRNLQSLVDAGMAITMELLSITEQQFLHGIRELLHNTNYTKNAVITAERFKDRPMMPQELVVYWTEYVLRHNGAHHLKSEALNLTWYQYMLLDVILVFIVSFLVIMYLIYKTFRYFYTFVANYLISVKVKQQ